MTTTTRERNLRGQGPRLREEIIQAAIALIDETNDASTLTLRGIARAAGISAPSIYAHFPDLPAVIDAVLQQSFQELRELVAGAMSTQQDPVVALKAGCGTYVRFGWEHKGRYRLMFAATGYSPNSMESFTLLEEAIERCVKSGASTSSDCHTDAYLIWVAVHGMATLEKPARADYRRFGTIDRPAMLAALIERLARLKGA